MQVNALLYFNCQLIVYNFTLLLYSIMAIMNSKFDYLAIFLPILMFGQVIIMTSFTISYYRLARVMKIYFSHTLTIQFKLMTRKSLRCHRLKIFFCIGLIYIISISAMSCRIKGDVCIVNEHKENPLI